MRPFAIILSLCLLFPAASPGQEAEKPKVETAPPPRLIEPAPPINLFQPAPLPMSKHGTREAWNDYAVDRFGRWRPRVILAPFGSYYYYNGQPYPWTTTNPGSFRPTTQN